MFDYRTAGYNMTPNIPQNTMDFINQRFCDQRHIDLERDINNRFKSLEKDINQTNDAMCQIRKMFYSLCVSIILELLGIIGILLKVSDK
jgi:hypothetical protein